MARFTLVLKPDGKALLVTPDDIAPEEVARLKSLWDEWRASNKDVLFVSNTDVHLVEDIELDLEENDGREERHPAGRQREVRHAADGRAGSGGHRAEPARPDDAKRARRRG